MKNNINKSFDGVYDFMSQACHGNWQYRWEQTPYLTKSIETGKREPISGHQWACIGFWFYFSRICPSLSALVDKAEIYERLWSHDIGETFVGDISQFLQLSGKGANKHLVEKQEIEKMGKKISPAILKQMTSWFAEFEGKYDKIEKLEVLLVKLIDTIQGDHFAFVFGNNLPENSKTINKIMARSFLPVANQLLRVLKQNGHKKAYKEAKSVILHHLKYAKRAGIKLDLKILG